MAHARDVLELNNSELCVLRWLRMSNGRAILSVHAVAGNKQFIVPTRLIKAGYVLIWSDDPKTINYILTERGREALEMNESTTFLAGFAKRRRARKQPRAGRDGGADRPAPDSPAAISESARGQINSPAAGI